MTVEDLLDRVTSEEMTRWIAYNKVSPITPDRTDYMIAQGLAMMANIHRSKDGKLMSPFDFMPHCEKPLQSKKTLISKIKSAFK